MFLVITRNQKLLLLLLLLLLQSLFGRILFPFFAITEENKLVTTRKAMERSMLGISLQEHIRNKLIRSEGGVCGAERGRRLRSGAREAFAERSEMKGLIAEYRKQKFCRARHTARFTDN